MIQYIAENEHYYFSKSLVRTFFLYLTFHNVDLGIGIVQLFLFFLGGGVLPDISLFIFKIREWS